MARKYSCSKPFLIDGDITKSVWSDIPWSEPFSDIVGNDGDHAFPPPPTCSTRFKMMWDHEYLYLAFQLESYNRTVATSYTKRNEPIYQEDSDIEVFLDAMGGCHSYKELEVNGYNTVWNLMLDKPYDDGGKEHSGRVASPGDDSYYEVNNQKTATKLLWGEWNSPSGAVWSVEMALSHSDTLHNYNDKDKERIWPQMGSKWRVNFSRVEEKGKINWTWAPQIIWDPKSKSFEGKVAMHLPDVWGYINFVDEEGNDESIAPNERRTMSLGDEVESLDPTWPARLAAMNYYYAQRYFHQLHGKYASNITTDLQSLIHPDIVAPFDVELTITKSSKKGETIIPLHYLIIVKEKDDVNPIVVTVTDDRLLSVVDVKGL